MPFGWDELRHLFQNVSDINIIKKTKPRNIPKACPAPLHIAA